MAAKKEIINELGEGATSKFKRKAAVSVPQLKLGIGVACFIEIMAPLKEVTLSTKNDKGENDVCMAVQVTDLDDGEIKQLLLDKIPEDAFLAYGEKLVGMKFEITKGAKVQSGKNGYHPYTIYEIE